MFSIENLYISIFFLGNCVKKMPMPLPNCATPYYNPVSNPQKPSLPVPVIPQQQQNLPPSVPAIDNNYQTRSVRDLANKFERNLSLPTAPNTSTRTNNIPKMVTVDPPQLPLLAAPSQVHTPNRTMPNETLSRSLSNSANWAHRKSPINQQMINKPRPTPTPPKEPSFDYGYTNFNSAPIKNDRYTDQIDGLRSINHQNQSVLEPKIATKQKVKGPKKSVKFSDQIVLVSGGDESENLLQNPLYKKVLQKSASGGHLSDYSSQHDDTLNDNNHHSRRLTQTITTTTTHNNAMAKTPCSLCHKKIVQSTNIYCTDCEFYMSRFKPRR